MHKEFSGPSTFLATGGLGVGGGKLLEACVSLNGKWAIDVGHLVSLNRFQIKGHQMV